MQPEKSGLKRTLKGYNLKVIVNTDGVSMPVQMVWFIIFQIQK